MPVRSQAIPKTAIPPQERKKDEPSPSAPPVAETAPTPPPEGGLETEAQAKKRRDAWDLKQAAIKDPITQTSNVPGDNIIGPYMACHCVAGTWLARQRHDDGKLIKGTGKTHEAAVEECKAAIAEYDAVTTYRMTSQVFVPDDQIDEGKVVTHRHSEHAWTSRTRLQGTLIRVTGATREEASGNLDLRLASMKPRG